MRWKFVFLRFRPGMYWWSLVLLAKAIWICLTTVAFTLGGSQVMWIESGIIVYLIAVSQVQPWRMRILQPLDLVAHGMLAYIIGTSAMFVEPDSDEGSTLGLAISLLSLWPLLIFLVAIGVLAYHRYTGKTDDVQEPVARRISERLSPSGATVEQVQGMMRKLSWKERDAVLHAANAIGAEMGNLFTSPEAFKNSAEHGGDPGTKDTGEAAVITV